MKTKITIEIIVRGDAAMAERAVERELDAGTLQDAINACPDSSLKVLSAVVTTVEDDSTSELGDDEDEEQG